MNSWGIGFDLQRAMRNLSEGRRSLQGKGGDGLEVGK